MKSMRNEFLAAAAAVALIAATGGVLAQDSAKPGAQGDVKVDANSQKPAGAKAGAQTGAQTQGGSAQMKTEGGAKVDAQAPKGSEPSTGTRAQGQDSKPGDASEGRGKVDAQAPKGAQDKDSQRGQAQDKDGQRGQGQAQSDDKPAQLNDQQRTRISSSIRGHKDVRRIDRSRVSFNINVGVAIPRSFTLYPLPAPILAVVPAYRGYLYIVVGDDLLIVHPRTYEIVAVIPA